MANTFKFADKATQIMVKRAAENQMTTVWERYEAMQPQCGFGTLGICCRHCSMGPCRIDVFGDGPKTGVCGANADTIAARHLVRMIAAGGAAHSDHGRDVSHTLRLIAEDPDSAYSIKAPEKLRAVAEIYGIGIDGKDDRALAGEVAGAALKEFGQQTGTVHVRVRPVGPAINPPALQRQHQAQ